MNDLFIYGTGFWSGVLFFSGVIILFTILIFISSRVIGRKGRQKTAELQAEITSLKSTEEDMRKYRNHLENLLETRTAELSAARDQAESVEQLKFIFLATMSHEIRTPLNSIIGFTGILMQELPGRLNDEQKKQLGMVQDSARHLLGLINNILDISKIESDQLIFSFEPFNMRKLLEKALQLITPLARKKGLTLSSEIAPDVGEIVSDARRVEQVVINLLNNAVKFTEKGEIRLECEIKDSCLTTRIKDSGIAIKPEDMDRIFEPFQQADDRSSRKYEGAGLGLSICKKLLDNMGGNIYVESLRGAGSDFTFTLPLQIKEKQTLKNIQEKQLNYQIKKPEAI
jgi:signal transduction histidine kinase